MHAREGLKRLVKELLTEAGILPQEQLKRKRPELKVVRTDTDKQPND
jgi:hypothetical protein